MGTIFGLLTFAALAALGLGGYIVSKGFVQRRLRFVDAVRTPVAPILAGALAFLLIWPFSILPFVSAWPAVAFAFGCAFGTASGIRAIRRGDYIERQLPR